MSIAITIDIKKSKNNMAREELQIELYSLCEMINDEFQEIIVAKFSIILGDELQGLIRNSSKLVKVLEAFLEFEKRECVEFYYGIGVGEISTKVNYQSVYMMDGDCFHNSRHAIDLSKKRKGLKVEIFPREKHIGFSSLLNLYIKNIEKLSMTAYEIYDFLLREHKQIDISKELSMAQSTVSEIINTNSLNELKLSQKALSSFCLEKFA